MSEHFLHFKKAFHRIMPPITFPSFSPASHAKLSETLNLHSKWVKLFSAGIIIYSGYYYLKRTSCIKYSFFSYFYHIKTLFSQRIRNTSTETNKNNVALEVKELPEHVKYDGGWYAELDDLKQSLTSTSAPVSVTAVFSTDACLTPLRETTPRGEIVMYYDAEKKTFNYYSNSKNIPYSTLDAVARKYVCLHKDPSIYIDIRDEIQKGREKCIKKVKHDKLKLEKNKNKNGILSSAKKSLFAAFKNYKTGQTGQRSVPVPKSLHNYDGNVKVEELVVIKDNINKFIYKGTLEQYEFDLKTYKNQHQPRQQDHIDNNFQSENENSFENGKSDHTNDDNDDGIQRNGDCDYFRLSHEKADLSYADFKKKYSH